MALSLGLIDDPGSRSWLADALPEIEDRALGKIALALGLMRDTTVAARLRDQLARRDLDWRSRLDLARALGLLHDTDAVPLLLDDLRSTTSSRSVTAANALALVATGSLSIR
jgi:HEAT repeat protein